jgi:hypothetical protein
MSAMTTPKIGWGDLHDASLVAISLDWGSGEASVRLRLSSEQARAAEIRVTATTSLRCPRQQPWGPSVSINEARVAPLPGGRVRLELELQSGDVIEIEGDAAELGVAGR